MYASLVTALLSYGTGALAWGALGHETVAYIAQNFVTDDTRAFCQQTLSNTSASYLAGIATWADSYRREKGGEFSAPFHYIDAEDSPPSSCNVDYKRDCAAEGCVVSALSNYTTRAMDKSLPAIEQNHALRFIVHFLGDIHQPLHVEAIAVGGNQINVTFDGESTNLHAAWDTSIPEKINGGEDESDSLVWSRNLTQAIKDGVFKDEKASWLSGMTLNDTIDSALIWARDSNAQVCSVVLPNGAEQVEGMELGSAYYESTVDTVETQIAKAGYRLAGWLNLMATGDIGLEVSQNATMHLPRSPYSRGKNLHSAAKLARREFGHDCHCDKH